MFFRIYIYTYIPLIEWIAGTRYVISLHTDVDTILPQIKLRYILGHTSL